jgi:RNA polymerase sigma-70 factor (ECF subfamily)
VQARKRPAEYGSNEDLPVDQGAEQRLTLLMNEHQRPLFAFLHSILSDPGAVQDCLQDTYMRAFTVLRGGGVVETSWLYSAGYNRAMDEIRRRVHEANL